MDEMAEEERFGYDTFLSPFTWRYGSEEMRSIFSEVSRRAGWRRLWVYLAEAQAEYGLLSREEVEDLRLKMDARYVDLKRSKEIEREIRHDVMAEIKAYAEQTPVGGGKLHLGATSADVEDNVDILRIVQAIDIIITRLVNCLDSLADNIVRYADLPCIGWTHLQPAEPTTLGYRLSSYAQDLLLDLAGIEYVKGNVVKGKGLKGAVGSSASFKRLLEGKAEPSKLEAKVMSRLGIEVFPISTQTYTRKVDHVVLSALSAIAQSAYKFGIDVRLLQCPVIGELSEPIAASQVGSSTMPFKRNPILSERMCSLARYIAALPSVSFMNAAGSLLERTLDDSANRRIIIPEGFLATDECLTLYQRIAAGLTIYPNMIKRNLERFGLFAGTEALMMLLVKRGGDRQDVHEKIRRYSFKAWEKVMNGEENPLLNLLLTDPDVKAAFTSDQLKEIMDPSRYIGDAPERSRRFVEESIRPVIDRYRG